MVISINPSNGSAPASALSSVGVISSSSSYVPSGHRPLQVLSSGMPYQIGRPNLKRSSVRSGNGTATSAAAAAAARSSAITGFSGLSARASSSSSSSANSAQNPQLYLPNGLPSGQSVQQQNSGRGPSQHSSRLSAVTQSDGEQQQQQSHRHHHHHHYHHHRIKPSTSGTPGALPLERHSFGSHSACSSLHSCHHDEYSFISPCVKYSLFFFNLLFWIIGAALMGLGGWSLLEEYDYNLLKFRNIFDFLLHISLGLVFGGFIVFSMSFTGCLGALRENLLLIKLYSLMLLLLFIAEVILSSLAFVFPTTLSHFVKDRLSKDLITLYREDTNLQNLIDIIQMEFKCCGVTDNGFKDWSMNIYFNCSVSNPSSERCAVPFSCCRDFNTGLINIMCGYNMQNLSSVVEVNKYVFTRGCLEAISELVERNMNLVAGICLGSALAQLFAMFLARSLQGQIFEQRARWM